jgi:hypothetical protein
MFSPSMLTPAELRVATKMVECQSRAETARALGLSTSTVRNLMRRARNRLGSLMTERERQYFFGKSPAQRAVRPMSLSDAKGY